jgi:hypothetical protein
MKIMIRLLIVGLASMTALASAEDESAFDQMKQMEGSWAGMLTRSTGEVVETRSTFRLISDGNTMVETLVEDGVEMLTTYSEQDGKLKVTHYCSLGTEPEFTASIQEGSVDLQLVADSGLHAEHHNYVSSMNYNLSEVESGAVVVSSTIMNGGAMESNRAVISRVE